jgi:hypothetical protein
MQALQHRNVEISALGEMSRVLQTEMIVVEGLEVTSLFCACLLPLTSGSIYLFRNSADLLELAASWGPAAPAASTMAPADCWALRRGQVHRYEGIGGLRCRHCETLVASPADASACLPLMAYGEAGPVVRRPSSPSWSPIWITSK